MIQISKSRTFGLLATAVGAFLFLSYFMTGIMMGRSMFEHGYDFSETFFVISDFLYMAGGIISVVFAVIGFTDKEEDKNGKILCGAGAFIGVALAALIIILFFV